MESPIRILSYNFFQRPPFIKNNFSDYKEVRLSLFITHILPHYDIICLQEMFTYGSSRCRRLIEAAVQKGGLKYHYSSPEKSLLWDACIDGGLLILSKYPLLSCQSLTFPRGVIADQ